MRCYKVGGCVRDKLLGLEVKDTDWVVTGATARDMTDSGFTQVGKDFPVFLHPISKEEYALARTERKSGKGYTGFVVHASPEVSLEQDLERRDITINAMAEDENGAIIDPFNGRADLESGTLRHVSPAFSEDPLRVLRVARFAARFAFKVAPETMELMRTISGSGELPTLPAERIWKEWQRALTEVKPRVFFEVLHDCGALDNLMAPQLATTEHLAVLDAASANSNQPLLRFAAHIASVNISKDWDTPIKELGRLYGISNEYIEAAQVTAECSSLLLAQQWQAETVLNILNRCDAFRRQQRFLQIQNAVSAQGARLPEAQQQLLNSRQQVLLQAQQKAASIGIDSLQQEAKEKLQGAAIGEALQQKRLEAIYEILPAR